MLQDDFRTSAKGIVIPHGLYDIGNNFGYLSLETSKVFKSRPFGDTSQFCCDNISYWWQKELQWKYHENGTVSVEN